MIVRFEFLSYYGHSEATIGTGTGAITIDLFLYN